MLRGLIVECCMKEPLLRPKAVELQQRTGMMFRMAQNEFVADTVGDHASLGLGSEHFFAGGSGITSRTVDMKITIR